MGLAAGSRLGPYEIQSPIGAGGMGEVYKARDTRLDRSVAIKVLPPDVSADPDRRARFEREAKTIAGLSHPHICTLHDVGEHDGSTFLVMEHLQGQTLTDRLAKGPLPLEQALVVATEIADALAAAHRQGIIHRDLKPGNVMLTKSGAKLLDFGLAKLTGHGEQAAAASLASTPTQMRPLTSEGAIVGTLQYMAPEQVEGKPADARTDLWALGAILYEMLTGKRAFEGTSAASLIGAILEREPAPLGTRQPLTPPALDRLVRQCLAKAPEDRPDTAHDVANDLRWMRETSGTSPVTIGATRHAPSMLWLAALTGAIVGGLATGLVYQRLRAPVARSGPGVVRTLVGVGPAERLQTDRLDVTYTEQRPSRTGMALSPDGRLFAFCGIRADRQQLYLRPLDQLEATPVADTDGAANPFFSPDGKWIGFWAQGTLRKIAVAGGPATTICQSKAIFGASWGDDDAIVFAEQMGTLLQVPAAGGTPRSVTTLDTRKGEVSHRLPHVLPGARAVVFTSITHYLPDWDGAEIVVQPLPHGDRKILTHGADARYVPTGHLVFVRSGSVVAAPFDVQRLELGDGATTVVTDVMQAVNTPTSTVETGAAQLAVSSSGLLLYATGGIFTDQERLLVWVDRKNGTVQPLPVPPRAYLGPHLSPDGQQVVVWTQGRERVVWAYDLRRGTMTRLTAEGRNSRAIWAPGGQRVTFASATAGLEYLASKPADGNGVIERLSVPGLPSSWSPNGQVLAFLSPDSAAAPNREVWLLPIGEAKPRPLVSSRFRSTYPEFSPDGGLIAYVSNDTGQDEVYVQPYTGPGQRQQLSNNGGTQPAWARNRRELFYTEIDPRTRRTRMMSVPLPPGSPLVPGVPRILFEGQFRDQAVTRGYDVTPDGQRFLMVQPKDRPPSPVTELVLVQNWFEELKAKVPVKR